jgi:hypothetical protein
VGTRSRLRRVEAVAAPSLSGQPEKSKFFHGLGSIELRAQLSPGPSLCHLAAFDLLAP